MKCLRHRQRVAATVLIGWATLCGPSWAQDVSCLGQVVPGERIIRLAAPPYSIITELFVTRGSRVKAGEAIAALRDKPLIRAQLERAEKGVAVARAELALAQAGARPELIAAQQSMISAHRSEAELLEKRLERYRVLVERNAVEQDRFDEVASQRESLNARLLREQSILESLRTGQDEEVTLAQASLQQSEAAAAEARALLELQTILAPIDGEILDIRVWPGECVGDSGVFASLGDTESMTVLAEVCESDLPRVKVGARATVRGQAFRGEVGGEVVEIQRFFEESRIFPLDPSAYVDRRIVVARIRPDNPSDLSAYSHAHVVVIIKAP